MVTRELLDTAQPAAAGSARLAAQVALDRATRHLTGLQDPGGWWQGELETNVTMDAEDLLLREFLGIRTEEETQAAARWIRSKQRADGTWANFHGGDGDLSTTVEAYVALRLAGDPPQAEHMTLAAGSIRDRGGIAADSRLHPHLAGAIRRMAVGRVASDAAGAHLPAPVVPAERL